MVTLNLINRLERLTKPSSCSTGNFGVLLGALSLKVCLRDERERSAFANRQHGFQMPGTTLAGNHIIEAVGPQTDARPVGAVAIP